MAAFYYLHTLGYTLIGIGAPELLDPEGLLRLRRHSPHRTR